MADITHRFFVDESGNSGANYLDAEQPYLVTGGWLVRASECASLEQNIRFLLEGHKSDEHHAVKLIRRPSGRDRLLALFRAVRAKAVPVFAIVEKGFAISARIVDLFLDPVFNPAAESVPLHLRDERAEIAQSLHSALAPETLRGFAEAIRRPSPRVLAQSLEAITAEALSSNAVDARIARMLANASRDADHWHRCASHDDGSHGSHESAISLNLPFFASLCIQVQRFTGARARVEVVHDEQAQFAAMFETAARQLSDGTHVRTSSLLDEPAFADIYAPSVVAFRTMDSKLAPVIQAADLLVTGLMQLFRGQGIVNWAEHPLFSEFAVLLMAILANPELPHAGLANFMVSEVRLREVGAVILPIALDAAKHLAGGDTGAHDDGTEDDP